MAHQALDNSTQARLSPFPIIPNPQMRKLRLREADNRAGVPGPFPLQGAAQRREMLARGQDLRECFLEEATELGLEGRAIFDRQERHLHRGKSMKREVLGTVQSLLGRMRGS